MLSRMSASARCPPRLGGLANYARGYLRRESSLMLDTSTLR